MTEPDDPIAAALLSLKAACTEDCRMYHAREVVRLKEQRGDYMAVIQGPLSADMRELMALALCKEGR